MELTAIDTVINGLAGDSSAILFMIFLLAIVKPFGTKLLSKFDELTKSVESLNEKLTEHIALTTTEFNQIERRVDKLESHRE